MKKITFLLIGLCVNIITYAQVPTELPVIDKQNIFMKVIDYIEFLATASHTYDNFKESEKIFKQGKEYYDSLKDVHSIVKKSRNVENCIRLSSETIVGYQTTYSKVSNDKNFSPEQVNVYRKQQENILAAMVRNISGLNNIIINTGMSLSDKERLDAIDTYHARITALHNESRGINFQILGESETLNKRKEQRRFERELLR